MVTFRMHGNFDHIDRYFKHVAHMDFKDILEDYGRMGVDALASRTPVRTGKTASSWKYVISEGKNGYTLSWINTNESEDGTPVVLLIEYGHATTYGYVPPNDFVHPAIDPIVEELNDILKKGVLG